MAIKKSSAIRTLEHVTGGLTFAKLIWSIRVGEELSQAEFARMLGISRAHLCDIEKGRRVVSPERASRWAQKLGFLPQQFVGLALQDQIDKAGLKFRVDVKAS